MLRRELLARLPKAELHVHLDGSLRPGTMVDLARTARVELPSTDPDVLRRHMRVDDARNLEEFLTRFELTIALLQTPEAIERVAWEMVEDAARDGIRLLEVRYCPRLSTRHGLSMDEVLAAERRGLEQGERDFGVRTGIINCALRQQEPAHSLEIAEASVRWRDRGVVALDLAGGEAGRPPGEHRDAFDHAALGGLRVTIHAGEAAGPESVREALALCHAERLGHGTRIHEDPALEDYVRDRQVAVEINLTSNLQTRVVERAADHPVRRYLRHGMPVTLCTDSWLMCDTTLTDEYDLAQRELGFTREEIDRMILNGFAAAFVPWPEKERILAEVRTELESLR